MNKCFTINNTNSGDYIEKKRQKMIYRHLKGNSNSNNYKISNNCLVNAKNHSMLLDVVKGNYYTNSNIPNNKNTISKNIWAGNITQMNYIGENVESKFIVAKKIKKEPITLLDGTATSTDTPTDQVATTYDITLDSNPDTLEISDYWIDPSNVLFTDNCKDELHLKDAAFVDNKLLWKKNNSDELYTMKYPIKLNFNTSTC